MFWVIAAQAARRKRQNRSWVGLEILLADISDQAERLTSVLGLWKLSTNEPVRSKITQR